MFRRSAGIAWIRWLIAEGYGERLLVAQDICFRHRLTKYGGHGYHCEQQLLSLSSLSLPPPPAAASVRVCVCVLCGWRSSQVTTRLC